MILDSSAMVAILYEEPGHLALIEKTLVLTRPYGTGTSR